ncbi:MAG: NRAMP family divalent metal transporter [Ktedonobacterales bacterium]
MSDTGLERRASIADIPLSGEDVKRAADRRRVRRLRLLAPGGKRSLLLLWLLVGPGILVMLGENDAPSMLSYAADGAGYGIGFFLPFVVLTFGMAYVVQEMTVRLGAATHRGHAELIFERFGPFWGWFAMGDLVLGNLLTLVTEFIGVRVGLGFFGVPPAVAVLAAFLVVLGATLTRRYWTWERIVLSLAIFNLIFIPVAILTHPSGGDVLAAFATWGPLPGGISQQFLLLVIASIGATVSPWMLFFQQSAVVDKGLTPEDIRHGRIDTALGAILAAIAACATIIATSVLFVHNVNVTTSSLGTANFATPLEHFVGPVGASLFAIGIFEAGLVAAMTISSSSAYAFAEVTHQRHHSLNASLRDGWPFYAVLLLAAGIAAVLVLIPNAPLLFIVLIVNVIAVLAMPPALIFLYMLCNDREIMGRYVSGRLGNTMAIAIVVFLVLASLGFGLTAVFPSLLPH